MRDETELQLGEWEPYNPDHVEESQRPTIGALNTFMSALHARKIPGRVWRAAVPDYESSRVRLLIYPDDQEFRRAVASLLPADAYEIEISDVQMLGN